MVRLIIIIISDEFALYYGWFVDAFHIVWWLALGGVGGGGVDGWGGGEGGREWRVGRWRGGGGRSRWLSNSDIVYKCMMIGQLAHAQYMYTCTYIHAHIIRRGTAQCSVHVHDHVCYV